MVSVLNVGTKSAILDMFSPVPFIPLCELGLRNHGSHSPNSVQDHGGQN